MSPKRQSKLWMVLTLFVIASLACNLFTPAPTATPAATPTPAVPPTPLPPMAPNVADFTPARGDELPTDGTITIYFDSPMDRASVESSFAVEPKVNGAFVWADDSTVTFKPQAALERASRYNVTIDATAKSRAGLSLPHPVSFHADTVGFLEVTQVLPAPDTFGADVNSLITVMFNRPVVPLTSLSQQAALPNPLTLDPPVEGQGEWLNTSIFVFRPAKALAGGQAYTGRIAAGLTDTTGGLLKEDFTWQFSTQAPEVVSSIPYNGQTGLVLNQPISITFNQPMDRASTEKAFSLSDPNGQTVAGTFAWAADGTGFDFTPGQLLARSTNYSAKVEASALAASGNTPLAQPFGINFTTIAPPAIVLTDPPEGAQNVPAYNGFRIVFAAPMDPATLDPNIDIVPKPTQVYTYWNEYDFSYYLSWDLDPSTDYVVTLGAGMNDIYGAALPEGRVIHFRTAKRDPQAYFNSNGLAGTYNAYAASTALYVSTVNQDHVDFALYPLNLNDLIGLTGPDSYSFNQSFRPASPLREWTVNIENQLDQVILTRVPLAEGGALAPGAYYLEMNANGPAAQYQVVVVSGANLTLKSSFTDALVWATDLQSGQPIPNYPITFYNKSGGVIASGQTDADGLFAAPIKDRPDLWTPIYAAAAGGAGATAFSVVGSDWATGVDAWDFGVNAQYYPTDLLAYLYTDRPLYRPGQVVYFKGVLRHEDDARFKLPDVKNVNVTITNDQGEQVFSDTLDLSAFGTFSGEFRLADEAGLGAYYINLNTESQPYFCCGVSFTVAEYRKPEFLVNASSPVTQTIQGSTIPVTVDASFFFGGPVSNADVHWSVLSADYVFNYKGSAWYDFYNYDYSSGEGVPQYGTYGQLISEKDGKTDANGQATLQVKADLSDSGVSQLYTIEALVTDPAGGQQVAGRVEVIVHQGQYYIGARPQDYIGETGKASAFDMVTVGWDGETPAANQKLHVVYNEHQWNCAQEKDPDTGQNSWTCHVNDTEVASEDVTTDVKGQATSAFTPAKGGVYQVKVSGTDSGGHTVSAATYIWVTDPGEYVTWRQNNNDRLTLIADRKSYAPGDTASILIPSPFQGSAVALVTVERGKILQHQVLALTSNSATYHLPITADYAPDVFVSVVIVKGTDENNPTPAFRMGLVKLTVSPERQQINVTLTPDKLKVGPRDAVTYQIQATDYEGKPVQAEFSVGLSDLAALSLAGPNSGPIKDAFYSERGLGVRTALGLSLSVDRLNDLAEHAKGGGGGAGQGFNEVRSNFLDTAFWKADVTTDANGRASFTVNLPDNLTTWRLDARGVSADTLVGQSATDIVATKDLLIRPQTPRFFVVGDQAQLAAVVNNNTAQDIQATVNLAAQGVTVNSAASQNVTVKANDRVEVTWDVTVEDVPSVDLTFSVEGGGLKDASKPTLGTPPDQTLPVYKYSAPETVGTAGQLDTANSILEAINLPRRFDVSQGDLSIELNPSLAAAMTGGLTYLQHYPYECTEQTVSRFLPNVLTYRALKQLGLAKPELEQELNALVNQGLQRLYARQHVDGGWGWWTTDGSNPFTSAYVVFGLVKAEQSGFKVSENVLNSGIAYLATQVARGNTGSAKLASVAAQPPTMPINASSNQQAFILYVLAEAGQPDTSATVQLFEDRENLDTYGRAYLALALHLIDAKDKRLQTLLSDINNTAILSATGAHWEEKDTDWWNMNTDTRSTAIVLDTLTVLDPQNQLIPNVVRWLMVARQAETWSTTQETAWALIGLTDWMVVSGELKANYDYDVTLNGQSLDFGHVSADNLQDSISLKVSVADLLKDQVNRLVINRNAGDGRLYYTAHLNVYFPVEDVKAQSRGVIVAREYTLPSADCGGAKQSACPPVSEAKAGQDIQVKVTLIAPNDLYYVVLEDPIPAGTEPIDTSLQTTSVVGQPPALNFADPLYYGWGWWWFSNTDLRDEKVVLFANYLPKGTYEYSYSLHASRPGVYKVIPTHANEFYFPEVFGRGDGMIFTINP